MYLFTNREREGFVAFDLVDQPNRHSVSTKLFRNQILVKIQHSIDSIFPKFVNKFDHIGKILLIIFIFSRFNPSPPASSHAYIAPNLTAFMPNSL